MTCFTMAQATCQWGPGQQKARGDSGALRLRIYLAAPHSSLPLLYIIMVWIYGACFSDVEVQ